MLQSCATFPEIGSLSAKVLVSYGFVFFCGSDWGWRKLSIECGLTALAVRYIAEEVKIVIEEI